MSTTNYLRYAFAMPKRNWNKAEIALIILPVVFVSMFVLSYLITIAVS